MAENLSRAFTKSSSSFSQLLFTFFYGAWSALEIVNKSKCDLMINTRY